MHGGTIIVTTIFGCAIRKKEKGKKRKKKRKWGRVVGNRFLKRRAMVEANEKGRGKEKNMNFDGAMKGSLSTKVEKTENKKGNS